MADTVTRALTQWACKAATAGGRGARTSRASGRRDVYLRKGILTNESVCCGVVLPIALSRWGS